ncbi:H-NS family nucleoid-associated regulatory protein [Rhizobium sp. Root482]|uniref:H-NS histone family protein n=1 Tax=Rhizobium sp. Root482 TaxID=1736543 RepID=UPI0009E8F539
MGASEWQGEPIGISELDELISEAQDLRERLVEKRPAELMAELEALGVSPPSLKRIRPPPRYKNGQGKTWTGGGKRPKWLSDHEAASGSRSDFLIK